MTCWKTSFRAICSFLADYLFKEETSEFYSRVCFVIFKMNLLSKLKKLKDLPLPDLRQYLHHTPPFLHTSIPPWNNTYVHSSKQLLLLKLTSRCICYPVEVFRQIQVHRYLLRSAVSDQDGRVKQHSGKF